MKRPVVVLALAVAAALAWWLLRDTQLESAAVQVRRPIVVVAAVGRLDIDETTEALGTTRAWESIEIRPAVSEIVAAIHVGDGQQVKAGDLLLTLVQDEERARLAEARALLAEQQREARRIEGLVRAQQLSSNQLDERRTLIEITRQRVAAAEAALRDRTLRAPFDGVLGLRSVSAGALVGPDTVVTTLDDIRSLRLDFTVPATRMGLLATGAGVEAASPALAGELFRGEVIGIDPRVNPDDRSVLVRARLDNSAGRLRPGMLLDVRIRHGRRNVLVVPEESITHYQREHHVLVVDAAAGNRVIDRPIEIGARVPGFAEVRSGLAEGERVVVEGLGGARPGADVEVRERDGATAPAP